MEEISVNGEIYVKSLVLAKKYGYTSDYLGQLCRGGDIDCTMVGRTWYVKEQSLLDHKKTRYRSTAAKSKSSLRQMTAVEVGPKKAVSSPVKPINQKSYHYESDISDLLPLIKKLEYAKEEEILAPNKPILSENEAFVEEKPIEVVETPLVIKRVHPRPRLRTIPAPVSISQRVDNKNAIISPIKVQKKNTSLGLVIALSLLTIVLEIALLTGSLGLKKQVIASTNGPAMVLYGFDLGDVKEGLSDLSQTFF